MFPFKKFYDYYNKRIIYYGKDVNKDYWDRHWGQRNLKKYLERGMNNFFLLNTINNYLPKKEGKILEGGCGIGQQVYLLQSYGYNIIGVDYAKNTVEIVKNNMPYLDVRLDDIRNLSFPDNYFIGYLSVGVIEHFWNGYDEILNEMDRVLKKGGYLFLSFPYMSLLRKVKTRMVSYPIFYRKKKKKFFQYILNKGRVISSLENKGFELIDKKIKPAMEGLMLESDKASFILKKLQNYQGNNIFIRLIRFFLGVFFSYLGMGHSILLVLKKVK